jgi:hypothetical protein
MLAGLMLLLCCLSARAQAPKAGVTWLADYEQGRRLARASGKPIFVVFRCEH